MIEKSKAFFFEKKKQKTFEFGFRADTFTNLLRRRSLLKPRPPGRVGFSPAFCRTERWCSEATLTNVMPKRLESHFLWRSV
jgi:hypothetical protein